MSQGFVATLWQPEPKLTRLVYETTDEIGKILRVHLEMERHLESVLRHVARDVDLSRVPNFSHRCQILRALRFSVGLVELLEAFNSLRNALSHRIDANIANNKALTDKIIKLGREGYSKLDDVTATIANKTAGDETILHFSTMSTVDQIVCIGQLATAILAATPETKSFVGPITVRLLPNVSW